MASSFNLTIEDSSPLIVYAPSGAWRDASGNDIAGLVYSGNTSHITTAPGATATINFHGTGIEIFGGHRPSFGTYTITVDGKTIASGTATSIGVETQQLLGSVSGLPNGLHTAVLTSTGDGMDIDWANLITEVGAAGSVMNSTIFDDADPAMTYAGPWQTSNMPAYMKSTLHYTQATGAAVSLSFTGNAVAVYGTVAPDHANMQISIDGKSTLVNFQSPFMSGLHPQTLLFYTNDLDSSEHTLILTNPGQTDGTGPFIDLDSVTVYSASTPPAVSAGDQAPQPSIAKAIVSKSSGLSAGVIAGIAVGVILAILIVLGIVFFLFFLRKRRLQRSSMDPVTPTDAELPLQGPNMRFTPVSPAQPLPTFSRLTSRMSGHSIAPSYYASAAPDTTSRSSIASIDSTTPMINRAPTLSFPKKPARAAQQGTMPSHRGRPPS